MPTRPPLVERAVQASRAAGFESSCRDADGALLHVLAGRRGMGRVGEIGAGVGVGSAWIVSALAPGTAFVTVESDPVRAAIVETLFADDPDVTVRTGDWRDWMPAEAPFDLLFVDGGDAKDDPDSVIELLQPRATVVLDDFTIGRPGPDPRREAWLTHPELVSVLLGTDGPHASLVAIRR